jgi:hypothetical protein
MRRRIAAAVALGLLLAPRWALAGDPLGDFRVDANPVRAQVSPAAAFDSGGNLLVLWWEYLSGELLLSRRFSGGHEPLGEPLSLGGGGYPESVAADRTGFTLISSGSGGFAISCRLDRNGNVAGEPFSLGELYYPRSASDGGRGMAVAVGVRYGTSPTGVLAFPLDAGRPAGKPIRVTADAKAGVPDVAMAADGRFVVIWANDRAIFGQRYTASGSPLGSPFWVGSFTTSQAVPLGGPRIAAAPDGRFAVAWPYGEKLFLRLYAPNGEPRTGPLTVTEDPYISLGLASMAMDAAGELLVAWDTFTADGTPEIRGRFHDSSGRPAGRAFSLTVLPFQYDSIEALTLAAGQAGKFAAIWQLTSTASYHANVFGRGLQWATPGEAPCFYKAGAFSCDSRRDGGVAEVTYAFGGRPGDVPLLGDLDGDGRDEPCVYRGPRFLCDPARDGGSAGASVLFGSGIAGGDAPLLGDLDGDGRDDPCVRQGDRFLCDTAHNGGTAELIVTLGHAGDPALLGDVDGDGADDPCVVEGGRLLCDTSHGGSARLVLPFDVDPAAGDVPLLGDMDGDGRDDPCIYRAGRFLCDTAHDGSLATTLSFGGGPGASPLFGDLQHL